MFLTVMAQQKLLTEEGLAKLQHELKELKETRRPEIAQRIESARELGDLSENAEYHSAKDEQAFIEGRIVEMEDLMHNALVVPKIAAQGVVVLGSMVKVKNETGEHAYTIVGANEADPPSGKISNESPLARAFLGKKIGDEVEISVPKGTMNFTILEIG